VQANAPAAIAQFATRLRSILVALGNAAKHAEIVVTGVDDPNPAPLSTLTHPLYEALDDAMATTAVATGARFAPLFDADLCGLTLLCSDGDAHPSDAGYHAIAERILEVL
jgi:lysophospholipase L1-like esterase